MPLVRREALAPSTLDDFRGGLVAARSELVAGPLFQAGGGEARYRSLLSEVAHIDRRRAAHFAQAAWQAAGGATVEDSALRLHFVRRAREVSARTALIEGALGGAPEAASPFSAALVAMHHYAACRDSRLLLAWEIVSGDIGPALSAAAADMRSRCGAPAPIAALFDGAQPDAEALLAPHLADEVVRFAGDALALYDALFRSIGSGLSGPARG